MKPFFSLLLLLCFFSVTAQNLSNERLKQQMVKDWERAKAYTQEYIDAMPADKSSFRTVGSMRSFAEQMLRLAFSNVILSTIGTSAQNSRVQSLSVTQIFEIS